MVVDTLRFDFGLGKGGPFAEQNWAFAAAEAETRDMTIEVMRSLLSEPTSLEAEKNMWALDDFRQRFLFGLALLLVPPPASAREIVDMASRHVW
jgi:hypothetical protein